MRNCWRLAVKYTSCGTARRYTEAVHGQYRVAQV